MERTPVLPTGRASDLQCPRCNQAIAPDDVNVELMVAMCRSCAALVELRAATRPPAQLLELAAPPDGIVVQEAGETLTLSWRWFRPSAQFAMLSFFTVFWNGFLVVWYAIALSDGNLCMALFAVLHLAVGVGLTYSLAAQLVNRTTLTAGPTHLTVTHGPLRWSTPEPVPVKSVDQFFVVEEDGTPPRFSVAARRPNGTRITLLSGLEQDVVARYLEQRLEAHLALPDARVAGEYMG